MMFKLLFLLLFTAINAQAKIFDLELAREKPQDKSLVWGPLFSFVLPGADQYYEKQYSSAFLYSSVALLGLNLSSSANYTEDIEGEPDKFNTTENNEYRKKQWGNQLYMSAGVLSAFHSYRSTVKYKKKFFGAFDFLPEQTNQDLLKAPFEFKYLKRKTTYLPLLTISGLVLLLPRQQGLATANLSISDAFFSSAYSFNAGVSEEALFRGMLMPNLYESYGSLFWSNTTTALIFGLAHGAKTLPIPQILAGYYFGWLTQKNNWSLNESVFVHTWWDVIAIGASYMQGEDHENLVYLPLYAARF